MAGAVGGEARWWVGGVGCVEVAVVSVAVVWWCGGVGVCGRVWAVVGGGGVVGGAVVEEKVVVVWWSGGGGVGGRGLGWWG